MKFCASKNKVNMFYQTGLHSGGEHSQDFHKAIARFAGFSGDYRKYMKKHPNDKGHLAFKWLTDNMRTDHKKVVRFLDFLGQNVDTDEIVNYWKGKVGQTIENGEEAYFFKTDRDDIFIYDDDIGKEIPAKKELIWDRTLESFTHDAKHFSENSPSFVEYSSIQLIYKNKKGIIGCDISGSVEYDQKEVIVGDHKRYKVLSVEEETEDLGQELTLYNITLEQLED